MSSIGLTVNPIVFFVSRCKAGIDAATLETYGLPIPKGVLTHDYALIIVTKVFLTGCWYG